MGEPSLQSIKEDKLDRINNLLLSLSPRALEEVKNAFDAKLNIDINKLVDLCFKLSDLSIKYSCNFNVLEKGRIPKQLGLKSILGQFIEFRKITIS